jgi:hypothetical protein
MILSAFWSDWLKPAASTTIQIKQNIISQKWGGGIVHKTTKNPGIIGHRFSYAPIISPAMFEHSWKLGGQWNTMAPVWCPELQCAPIVNCHLGCCRKKSLICAVNWQLGIAPGFIRVFPLTPKPPQPKALPNCFRSVVPRPLYCNSQQTLTKLTLHIYPHVYADSQLTKTSFLSMSL